MGMSGGCSWCKGHGSGTTQHITHKQNERTRSEMMMTMEEGINRLNKYLTTCRPSSNSSYSITQGILH
jgi:hypothetical protein